APHARRVPRPLLHLQPLRTGPRPHARRALDRCLLPGRPANRGSLERLRPRTTWLVASRDAEGVDCCVYLHGGEGGLRWDMIGDRDRVIAARKLVVEEQERIAL